MIEYNYNMEVIKNLAMFESAFDDALVKRFDFSTQRVTDTIKVNYVYGPKGRTFIDLEGQPDTVKFPIVAVNLVSQARDNDRIRNKIDPLDYQNADGSWASIVAIPWNMKISMDIITKSQQDMDQIIQNFVVYTNPYLVYSLREPKTGRELRVEVLWDENITHNYPGANDNLEANKTQRWTSSTSFTIKTFLFRTKIQQVKPICFIQDKIIIPDKFYCDYMNLSRPDNTTAQLDYEISGKPILRYVDPYYFRTGQTPTITLQGEGFANTFAVFLSGSNPAMFPNSVQYVPGSAQGDNTIFTGQIVETFSSTNPLELSFTMPSAAALGFVDIIAVNPCGFGQLTVDANRCNRVKNPYPITVPEHYSWCVQQFPFLNGLVITNDLNPGTVIDKNLQIIVIDEASYDRDALLAEIRRLMTLGDFTVDDL
jgi:hypothetical protein